MKQRIASRLNLGHILYHAALAILKLNEKLFGTGSSHELCRDLKGSFQL